MNTTLDTRAGITICGAGLAGSLLAILLARQGIRVRLFERLADMRSEPVPAGRSINMALAARGIRALEMAGVMPEVEPLLIEMPGRMLHDPSGAQTLLPYGQANEVIYSVSRPGLNRLLLDAAQRLGVEIFFRHAVIGADFTTRKVHVRRNDSDIIDIDMHQLIGTDGAGSVLRHALVERFDIAHSDDLLAHGYKELTIPPAANGGHRIERHALHIWPRGNFMLIALPNTDGSFTATLFAPHEGDDSFATLTTPQRVRAFFARHFSDALALIPTIETEFAERPIGVMGTVHCARWSVDHALLLLGDAAHAITPFHGQGMNCAFEDCAQLAMLLARDSDLAQVFATFEQLRRPNTDAIAQMAIENYLEMRDTVRDPTFQLQKALSLELERRFPHQFVPRYSMVMFHERIPYSVALERGRIQGEILSTLTASAQTLDQIDWARAAQLIETQLESMMA